MEDVKRVIEIFKMIKVADLSEKIAKEFCMSGIDENFNFTMKFYMIHCQLCAHLIHYNNNTLELFLSFTYFMKSLK